MFQMCSNFSDVACFLCFINLFQTCLDVFRLFRLVFKSALNFIRLFRLLGLVQMCSDCFQIVPDFSNLFTFLCSDFFRLSDLFRRVQTCPDVFKLVRFVLTFSDFSNVFRLCQIVSDFFRHVQMFFEMFQIVLCF